MLDKQRSTSSATRSPPRPEESVEVNANGWDIYDTFATDPVPKHQQIQDAATKQTARVNAKLQIGRAHV